MKLYLQGILFTRAQNYAARRGFSDEKERAAVVDGWLAGFAAGKRKDARVDKLLADYIEGDAELAAQTPRQLRRASFAQRQRDKAKVL
jgi:hypothetical protein